MGIRKPLFKQIDCDKTGKTRIVDYQEKDMKLPGLFFITVGLFAIAGAILDWDWFMNSRKARFMVRVLTRNGARIFYSFLGLTLFILGLLGIIGVIDLSN